MRSQNAGARGKSLMFRVKCDWQLYLLILPILAYLLVFNYLPLYGIQIAFKNFRAVDGIWGSRWVGLQQFETFFSSYYFSRLISNTFLLNLYALLWGFPIPVFLAILLNRINNKMFKKYTQTVIYVPHFISVVVLAGMVYIFCAPTGGLFNVVIRALGGSTVAFMTDPGWFRSIYIGSGIWQSAGWGTILYLAALTGVDPEIYEAATIDGATILQKIRYIDVPMLVPIATMMLILNSGSLLSSNTEKALLFQTAGNIPASDVIGLYVYKVGLEQAKFSFAAAIGLFVNVVNFVLILTVNTISNKMGDTSLF